MGTVDYIKFGITLFQWVVGGSLVGLLGTLYHNFKLLRQGTQAILRDRLVQGHRYWMDKGAISYTDKENYLNMYNMYHNLGSNGVMDSLVEDIKRLPLED